MLEPNSFIRFHSGQYQLKVPFIIYTKFELILKSLEDETELDPEAPYERELSTATFLLDSVHTPPLHSQ